MTHVENNRKRIDEEIIGKRIGKLLVLERAEPYTHRSEKNNKLTVRSQFKCICDCGNYRIANTKVLRKGSISMCMNCAYKTRPQSTERLSNIERLYALSIVSRCKDSKIENNLSLEEFENIVKNNCYYCNNEPRIRTYIDNNKIVKRGELLANGVDRLDSNKGYSIDNCVPCCTRCNTAKNTLSEKDFINHIIKIYNHYVISKKI